MADLSDRLTVSDNLSDENENFFRGCTSTPTSNRLVFDLDGPPKYDDATEPVKLGPATAVIEADSRSGSRLALSALFSRIHPAKKCKRTADFWDLE